MKVDVCATEPQYLAHMLPIWAALPGELRGEVHPLGTVGHPPRPRKGRVALVAGWQDVHPLRGLCDMIYVEHGAGQTYCLAPETRVLTAGLRWKPIGELLVGEELVAFDEHRGGERVRQWRSATVLESRRLRLPCYEITFEDGTKVTASAEHKWLKRNRETAEWITTANLQSIASRGKQATKVLKVADTWEEDTSWGAGYLAAAFDGEGCLTQTPREGRQNRIMLAFTQKANPMMDVVQAELRHRGFEFTASAARLDGVQHLHLRGGLPEMLRFLGSIRPRRLLEKFQAPSRGMLKGKSLAVADLRFLGDREVVGLATSTGTLVAEGLASHNSDNPNQPSYSGSGGQRHQGVIGYISPNSTVAARWHKPAAAVGCPKMDHWRNPPTPPKSSVCFAWHWMCTVAPETKSAWPHYSAQMGEVIERYRDQGFEVLIHEHPRWRGKLVHEWSERFDVEVLRSDVEVFERASILMVDNSSLGMEFMLLDRPVVWLNAPWYRRDVHHGGRFWEWTDGVPCIDHPEALLRLNLWDVNAWQVDPTVDTRSHQWAHARRTYEFVDGGASMRAAAFIAQLLEGK